MRSACPVRNDSCCSTAAQARSVASNVERRHCRFVITSGRPGGRHGTPPAATSASHRSGAVSSSACRTRCRKKCGCRNCMTPRRCHVPFCGPGSRSTTTTLLPARASMIAEYRPIGPAPTTTTLAMAPPVRCATVCGRVGRRRNAADLRRYRHPLNHSSTYSLLMRTLHAASRLRVANPNLVRMCCT
jgi:hypothetical protein